MSSATGFRSLPTVSSLYRHGELHQAPANSTLHTPSSALNIKVSLIRTDITKLDTTCIVNAANTSLLGGSGVDGAIHAAAGPGLYDECVHLHGCPTGSAKITSAHALPSKHVIHAVGPIYAKAKREGGENRPKELLEGCYRTSLDLAAGLETSEGNEEISIAFSCLSTGVYGYPSNEAAGVASRCVRNWLEEAEREGGRGKMVRVVFCCFLEKDVKAYEEWLPKVFPPTNTDLASRNTGEGEPHNDQDDEGIDGEEEAEAADDVDNTTGNTQTLATTTLASEEPATKKQKQTKTSSSTNTQHVHSAAASAAAATDDDDREDWEAVERPQQPSLASSTFESTTSASDVHPSSENLPMDESTVHVDADAAAAAAKEERESHNLSAAGNAAGVSGGGLEDEGVEVEKPRGVPEEGEDDDDGVKVERPKATSGMGKSENMLGKDW